MLVMAGFVIDETMFMELHFKNFQLNTAMHQTAKLFLNINCNSLMGNLKTSMYDTA